jgi:hypothetical protein
MASKINGEGTKAYPFEGYCEPDAAPRRAWSGSAKTHDPKNNRMRALAKK